MDQCTSASGIHLHTNTSPSDIIKEVDGKLTVKLEGMKKNADKPSGGSSDSSGSSSSSSAVTELRGNDTVVLAVGRAGKTKGLGLEDVGVEMGPKGSIKVDEYSRTNLPHIWAVGDVTSRIALTPVAIMEGQAVGESIANGKLVAPEYDAVPSACFSWPFVATVVSMWLLRGSTNASSVGFESCGTQLSGLGRVDTRCA
jgi:glutathione reductase (NADPH)